MNKPNAERASHLDYILSLVLRIGLLLAICTISYGAILLLWESSREKIDYHTFDNEPAYLKNFFNILNGVDAINVLSIIQLGITILIATPILRVVSCLIFFAATRDRLYFMISAFVLGVLLYANLNNSR